MSVTPHSFNYLSDIHHGEDPFTLDGSFLSTYRTRKPKFGYNGLGEFVFYRTYSRLKTDNTKETFFDVMKRVVEGCYEIQRRHCRKLHVPWDYPKALESAHEMFQRMWDFKFLPPGRGLWCMGTPFIFERGSAALNNCGYVSTQDLHADSVEPFTFLMDMSMLGVGTGFDTRGKDQVRVLKPNLTRRTRYTIPDSREGWVESVRIIIMLYLVNPDIGLIEFDYSNIREAGTPIRGFGGYASGPSVLHELHERLIKFFNSCVGKMLTSAGITDVMNMIGAAVVAGNVRRCLPKGTLVHLKRGLVPIEQVQVGDMVLTADGYSPVAENVQQGVQRVVTINTQMGPFRCTDKHRIAVMTGIGRYEWKRARQLKPGDRMVFVDAIVPGSDTVLPGYSNFSTRGNALAVPGLSAEVAWFIGSVHGDGYVYPGRSYMNRKHHGASVMIAVNCDEYHDGIVAKIEAGFSAFGFHNVGEQPSKDNCHKVRVISRQLSDYFYKHFKQARTPLGVPECIRMARSDIRAAYLAGLLDSDGSVKNRPTTLVVSVYRDFLRQVQSVYSSLGIPTKLRLRRDEDGASKAKWELALVGDFAIAKFRDLVEPHAVKKLRDTEHASGNDFGYPAEWIDRESVDYGRSWSPQCRQMTHNRAVLCGADTKHLVPVEVYGVVDEGIEVETYDLSVPDRNEFVAQGLLVHNTAELAFGDADDPLYVNLKNPVVNLSSAEANAFWAVSTVLYKKDESKDGKYVVVQTDTHQFLRYHADLLSKAEAIAAVKDDQTWLDKNKDWFKSAMGIKFNLATLPGAIDTWNSLNQHRWASNNSVYAHVGMDYRKTAASTVINGEPGYIWLENLRDYGRLIDGLKPGCDAGVMGTNPCGEQSLESFELCCLSETFPAFHDSPEDYLRTLKFAYLYAKTVTLLPTHYPRTNAVMLRNRRIGLSQSGIVQAFEKFGRRPVLRDFCDAGYEEVSRWDRIYSKWLCIPQSIKKTCVKPSGTISLVTGACPGIHYPEAKWYWRRARVDRDSILVDILRDAGYHLEPSVTDPARTMVVKFAVDESNVRPVGEVSIWEQVQNVADYQKYWTDNQPSCTVKFKRAEAKDVPLILECFEDRLKCISLMPADDNHYAQAPYEPCTKEEVEAYNAMVKPIDFSRWIGEDADAAGTKFCDGASCAIN